MCSNNIIKTRIFHYFLVLSVSLWFSLVQFVHTPWKLSNSIAEHSRFNRELWKKFILKSRKHIMYYGLSLTEKALNIEITSNKIEIPLLEKLKKKLQNLMKKKDAKSDGFI